MLTFVKLTKILQLPNDCKLFRKLKSYKSKIQTKQHLMNFGLDINLICLILKYLDARLMHFIHKEMRWKLNTHSIYCIFFGYNDKSKAYQLLTTNRPQILTSRDIIFHETHMNSTYNFIQQDDEIEKDSLLDANLF